MYLPDKILKIAELNGTVVAFAYKNSTIPPQNFTTDFYLYHVGSHILIPLTVSMPYDSLQQQTVVWNISHLVEGSYSTMYRAETPEIRRPPTTQYDIPIPPSLIKIPRRRFPQRGPGRQPPIPPGSEDDKTDKKKKDPPTIQ